MAITELASPAPLSRPAAPDLRGTARVWPRLPVVIGLALLATILYSAFAHGAVTRSSATAVELVVAGLSAVGALGWLWLGTLRLSAPRATVAGVALLAGFACWSGVSVLWSINPDQTWIEVNRALTYMLVAGLGIALGASHTRAVELVARGFVLAALAVTAYALGQKVLPGLHLAGVFDLNQTGELPRLQEPLGYWNALALFMVMAAPAGLALAADSSRSAPLRLSAACALALILITVPLTYSRGGLIALAVALAVGIGLSGERLRSAIWLGAALAAAAPAILVGLLMPQLSTAFVALGTREWAGGVLAVAVIGGLAVLALAGSRLVRVAAGIQLSPARARALRRGAVAGAAVIVVVGLAGLALSTRGFTGTLSHAWQGFTSTHGTSNYNPQRLLSADSENRWVWWKEAAAAFSARPWQGWGAGSFPVLHLLYRRDTLPVQQPHSVPLQFLAETGIIGALLAIGAFVLLAAGGFRAVRSRVHGSDRLLAAALLGGAVAYGVHCLYDWDWNIPALSLPAFLFLAVVAGARMPQRSGRHRGSTVRALALAGVALWLCTFALSVELPQLAADRAAAALVAASSPSPAVVRSAQSQASLASQLDPLSDAGPQAEATVALHRSQPGLARFYLQQAVSRDPSDPEAWRLLAAVDYRLKDETAALLAAQRAADLDPMGTYARAVVAQGLHNSLPSSSATRFATPPPGS